MSETDRDVSDERSTPTECSVASLLELKRRGTGSLNSRIEWVQSGLRVLESSGGCTLENPPRLLRQVQSSGKREVPPDDCRARSA